MGCPVRRVGLGILALVASVLIGATGYDASAERKRVFLEDYGVVVNDGSDDLAAIQSAIAANPGPVDFTLRTPGVIDIAQTALSHVIKPKAGQRWLGGGSTIRNTGICCPVFVVVDAPGAQLIGWKIVHHASRTDAWTASNIRLQVQQDVIPSDGQAESTWYGRTLSNITKMLENRGESDLGALVYIGNSPGAVVQSCKFSSDQSTEKGFNRAGIYVDLNEDMTPASGIVVDDCQFEFCIQGILGVQVKNSQFTNLKGLTYWNIGPNASNAAGHMVYITGGLGSSMPTLGTDNLCADILDLGTSFVNTGGTVANDFYYEPSVKFRNQHRLTATRIFSRRAGGGFDLASAKACAISHIFVDQRAQVANGSTNAQANSGFRIDRNGNGYPAGFTVADFGGNTIDDIWVYAIPDTVSMGNAWVSDLVLTGYDGTTPLHKNDVYTKIRIYVHLADSTSSNKQPIPLCMDGATLGTVSAPVYIGRVGSTSWPSDFQAVTLYAYCKNTTLNIGIDAPNGSFTSGHGPQVTANGAAGSGNTINGSPVSPGGAVTFTSTLSAP